MDSAIPEAKKLSVTYFDIKSGTELDRDKAGSWRIRLHLIDELGLGNLMRLVLSGGDDPGRDTADYHCW